MFTPTSHFADPEFCALPDEQRDRVLVLLSLVHGDARGITKAGGLLDKIARAAVCTRANAKRMYYAWKQSHDWRDLCDKRSLKTAKPEDMGARSPRFIAFVETVCEEPQRSVQQAINHIHNAFRYGCEVIPGFESWQCGRGVLPHGVSETALRKMIKRANLVNARMGYNGERANELPVLTTRAGLPVGSIYEFDDVWHDHLVIAGSEQVRVLEFGCIDLASACRIHWGHAPHQTKEDGKKQGLTQQMFVLFVAYVLRYIGFDAKGVQLKMEHGTATMPKRMRELLENCGMGIKIAMGGIKGYDQAKLGGHDGIIKGNARFKSRIEVSHSGLHHMLSALPGQVGKDRQHMQESTAGRQRKQQELERWKGKLVANGRADLAERLEGHLMTLHQFSELLISAVQFWNGRTDHQLEGWGANTAFEYDLGGGNWVDNIEHNPMVEAYLAKNPKSIRTRKLSPTEVWNGKKSEWVRIPLALYYELISEYGNCEHKLTVRKKMLAVQDKLVSSDQLFYLSDIIAPDGRAISLEDGKKYRCILNPYALNSMIVLDERGKILGEAPQHTRARLDNPEEVYQQMGRVRQATLNHRAEQQVRHTEQRAAVEQRHERNRAIAVEGGALVPKLKAPTAAALPKPRRKAVPAILTAIDGVIPTSRPRRRIDTDI